MARGANFLDGGWGVGWGADFGRASDCAGPAAEKFADFKKHFAFSAT